VILYDDEFSTVTVQGQNNKEMNSLRFVVVSDQLPVASFVALMYAVLGRNCGLL
jgi:hypothetical protein